jgi:hypothetical protein
MTNSETDNRPPATRNCFMTAWSGTRVYFTDLTWSKQPGRRLLRFSRLGIIIRPLIFQIMLRAPGDRKQPSDLSNGISIIGFPQTGCSGIVPSPSPLAIGLLLLITDRLFLVPTLCCISILLVFFRERAKFAWSACVLGDRLEANATLPGGGMTRKGASPSSRRK